MSELISKEELIRLHTVEKKTLSEIGRMYGISKQRVSQIKSRYQDKERKPIRRRLNVDPFTLYDLFLNGWTVPQVSEAYSLTKSQVYKIISDYKKEFDKGVLPVNLNEVFPPKLPKEALYKLYVDQAMTDAEIASLFSFNPSSVKKMRCRYNIETIKDKKYQKLKLFIQNNDLEDEINNETSPQKLSKRLNVSVYMAKKLLQLN